MNFKRIALVFAGLMMFAAPMAAAVTVAPSFAEAQDKKAEDYIKDVNDLKGATELLVQVDKNHNPYKDQTLTTRMVLNGGTHHDVTYQFKAYSRDGKRSVRFYAPAEMKGMGVVTKGRDEVYARLPGSEKARRVGTHSKRQSFYGSDWIMDDNSMFYYAQDFDVAKIINLNEDGKFITLELKLKATTDLPYAKLIVKIRKSIMLMEVIEYYGEDGKKIKTQERHFDSIKKLTTYDLYTHVTVTDAATGHRTDNYVEAEEINTNFPDSTFQQRWLTRSI